ncbi:hypothetical protein KPH14_012256, partial [Odynerus spinipes]
MSDQGNAKPWGVVYKTTLDKLRIEQAMSNIRTGTGHTMGWRDTAETLLEALIPDDIEANESPEQVLVRVEATTQPDVGDAEVFSGAELRKAILALKRGKCPGLDRIEAEA